MSRLLSEEELEGRLDCFGEFDSTDEICLYYCGVNISCAASMSQQGQEEWSEEEDLIDPMDIGLE